MNRKNRKRRPALVFILLLLLLIGLACAFPFVYDRAAGFDDYDDLSAISEDDIRLYGISVEKDGTVLCSVDKKALLALAEREGLFEAAGKALDDLGPAGEKTEITAFGVNFDGKYVSASVKLKALGFVPVQLHADAELIPDTEKATVKPVSYKYGQFMEITPQRAASLTGLAELEQGFTFDHSAYTKALCLEKIAAGKNLIDMESGILKTMVPMLGDVPAKWTDILSLIIGGGYSDMLDVFKGDFSGFFSGCATPEDISDACLELASFAGDDILSFAEAVLAGNPLLEVSVFDAAGYRDEAAGVLSSALYDYEKALSGLRDSYKNLEFTLTSDYLRLEDGSPVEDSLPDDWQARIVLQYNRGYDSVVLTNDGEYSYGLGKWRVLPNPDISKLRRDKKSSLPSVKGVKVFDLTLAVRMADHRPALIYYTAEGDFAVNVISEELFAELSESERLPVLCASDVPRSEPVAVTALSEGQKNGLIYL